LKGYNSLHNEKRLCLILAIQLLDELPFQLPLGALKPFDLAVSFTAVVYLNDEANEIVSEVDDVFSSTTFPAPTGA
jgi:hypothetical protein